MPSPSGIRSELRLGTLVSAGQVQVEGHSAYRLRLTVPSPGAGSNRHPDRSSG
ncbi:MAG TPA: hypothetical protein VFB06_00990 [Streptosporangiaceae bacterium]|nr:hypothetical protein [Streptosporangiaceae bacterium]